ncbi:MAG: protease inhibitor I42 family protein [Streptococcus sp.]|nr:protease inhibitor I42 family protein [Streptococcus sp.]
MSVIAVATSYFLLEKSYPDIVSYGYSGKKFHFRLKSNGSTGFSWETTANPSKNLTITENEEAKPSDGSPLGVETQTQITGKVLEDGQSHLTLIYKQNWSGGEVASKYKVTIYSKDNEIKSLKINKIENKN